MPYAHSCTETMATTLQTSAHLGRMTVEGRVECMEVKKLLIHPIASGSPSSAASVNRLRLCSSLALSWKWESSASSYSSAPVFTSLLQDDFMDRNSDCRSGYWRDATFLIQAPPLSPYFWFCHNTSAVWPLETKAWRRRDTFLPDSLGTTIPQAGAFMHYISLVPRLIGLRTRLDCMHAIIVYNNYVNLQITVLYCTVYTLLVSFPDVQCHVWPWAMGTPYVWERD